MTAKVHQIGERSIFLAALEQDCPEQRNEYLATACGRDAAMRERVEALLRSHEGAASLFDKLAPERIAEELATDQTVGPGNEATASGGTCDNQLGFLTPSDKPDSLGRLGSYEVEEVVGRGGMGIVLRAFDEKLHRAVAIKVMTPPLASNEYARRRFIREGRAAAAVRDDHVIGIHGVDETNGLPMLVMEYVVGRSLGQRLEAEGPLPVPDILRIGSQIARGLAAAHAQGLVHRDIKPANILLENGVERVKITDFGLAHAVDDVRTTQPGTVIGTPEYMSPEQARGEKVDHRSDLFSLGCVLYAMCAGRPPFRAESTVAIIRRVCDDTPRPLTEINSDIPGWLVDLINKLIAKDANERFQSAAEVAELLGQYLAHVQQPAINPSPVAITKPRPVRRQTSANARRGWSIAAAAVLVLCAGLSLAESTGITNVAATVIRIVRGDGTLVVEVDDPNIQVLVDGEELVISGAGPKEIRLRPGQHELHTVKDGKPVETKLITITKGGRDIVKVSREEPFATKIGSIAREIWHDAADRTGAISEDGRYFAYTNWETGDIAVRELTTGKTIRITNKTSWQEPPGYGIWARPSRDGSLIAFTYDQKIGDDKPSYEIRIIESVGGQQRSLFKDTDVYPVTLGWSSDAKSLVVKLIKEKETEFTMMSVSDGSRRTIKTIDTQPARSTRHCFSAESELIAYSRPAEAGSTNRDVYLIDIRSGEETRLTGNAPDEAVLGWTPDGRHLLIEMNRQANMDAWLLTIEDRKLRGEPRLVKRDLGIVEPLGITRRGTFHYTIAFGGPSIFVADVDYKSATASASMLWTDKFALDDNIQVRAWSPDAKHVAIRQFEYGRSELKIISTEGGEIRTLQPKLEFRASGMHWAPDGRSILIFAKQADEQAGVYKVDVSTGDVTTLVTNGVRLASGACWSADGGGVYYNNIAKQAIVHRDIATLSESEIVTVAKLGLDDSGRFDFALSPDQNELAVYGTDKATNEPVVRVMTLPAGSVRDVVKLKGRVGRGLGWSLDGAFLIFRNFDQIRPTEQNVYIVDVRRGTSRKLELSGIDKKQLVGILPNSDGKKLALHVRETTKYQHWALENFLPSLDDPKPPAAANATAAVATPAKPAQPPVPATRQVWNNAPDSFSGSVSPNGRYVAVTDWISGDIAIRDLNTETTRRLTNQGYPEMGGSPIFSPDSQQIAYRWLNKEKLYELRICQLDGSAMRVLVQNSERGSDYPEPCDWSSDGKHILATFSTDRPFGAKLALISVADGSQRVLQEDFKWYWQSDVRLSPDGRYAAYSARVPKTRQRDIFVLPTDGSEEMPLVQHSADDALLGWTPDGKRVLFSSDRTGASGLWLLTVADGKPQGPPLLVRSETGHLQGMRLTRDGSLYYGRFSGGENVYTAKLDLANCKLLTPPIEAMQTNLGFNWSPDWSPDGRYLACITNRGQFGSFLIRSLETNEVREVQTTLQSFNLRCLRWLPDGKELLVGGPARRIDIETGKATKFAKNEDGTDLIRSHPFMSKDGKFVIHQAIGTNRRIFRYTFESKANEEIYAPANRRLRSLALSPDDQQLAAAEGNAIRVIPVAGGEPREVLTLEQPITAVAWTPDGKQLIFGRSTGPESKWYQSPAELWRVSATGGEPQKLADNLPAIDHLRIHPDGTQIAFCAHSEQDDKHEIWALENFLPPLDDTKPPAAADASAAKNE